MGVDHVTDNGTVDGSDQKDKEGEARARALDLLEATHQFPCDYAVTVIAFNRATVTEAVKRAVGRNGEVESEGNSGSYEFRASREGKYLSHRFAVRVSQADDVLALYARLRCVDGVVTIL